MKRSIAGATRSNAIASAAIIAVPHNAIAVPSVIGFSSHRMISPVLELARFAPDRQDCVLGRAAPASKAAVWPRHRAVPMTRVKTVAGRRARACYRSACAIPRAATTGTRTGHRAPHLRSWQACHDPLPVSPAVLSRLRALTLLGFPAASAPGLSATLRTAWRVSPTR